MIVSLALVLGSASGVFAQGGGARVNTQPPSAQKKAVQQAQERLRQAQQSGELDKAKGTARGLLDKLPGNVTDAARSVLKDPNSKAQAVDAVKSAAQTILPEAQRLLKNNPDAAAAAAAAAGQAIPGAEGTMPAAAQPAAEGTLPAPTGPVPAPLQPIQDQPPAAGLPGSRAQAPMVQIEADRADFDPSTGIYIYIGNVKARHPDFYIQCQQLEVYMEKMESEGGPKKAPAKKLDPVRGANGEGDDDPPIIKAIATGPMVMIEKRSEEGDIQQGRCRRLVYEKSTGKITLSDNPQVQRGNILQIAADPGTTMVFDKNGRMNTNGNSRTVILSQETPATQN